MTEKVADHRRRLRGPSGLERRSPGRAACQVVGAAARLDGTGHDVARLRGAQRPGGGEQNQRRNGLDYVRTAWSKGLPTHIVLLRHILRPALVQIITVFGVAFSALLAGSVLVEYVFSWPGLGQYAYRSTTGLDLPSITGITLFVAAVYVGINFVVDVLYGVIDPRIRLR